MSKLLTRAEGKEKVDRLFPKFEALLTSFQDCVSVCVCVFEKYPFKR